MQRITGGIRYQIDKPRISRTMRDLILVTPTERAVLPEDSSNECNQNHYGCKCNTSRTLNDQMKTTLELIIYALEAV
jgi:hypothetical protein